jgi:hypothetical protein
MASMSEANIARVTASLTPSDFHSIVIFACLSQVILSAVLAPQVGQFFTETFLLGQVESLRVGLALGDTVVVDEGVGAVDTDASQRTMST